MTENKAIDCLMADKEYLQDMHICDGEEIDMAIDALRKIQEYRTLEEQFKDISPKTIVKVCMELLRGKEIVNDTNNNNKCIDNIETIKIKYFDKEIDKIEKISNGDWVDLRSAETIALKKGEFHLIPLGIGMKLPTGYEANIVPRSSTYKNFKVVQTNSFAVIDNSYSGNNDQWFYPVIAMEDTTIHKNERICQFRINKTQPELVFEEAEHLDDTSRGGFGSTGTS